MSDLSAGRVILPVEPDTSKFASNLSKGVTGSLGTLASIGKKAGTIAFASAALVGGTLTAMALKGGLSRALNIQDAQEKLRGLGHDTKSITTIMGSALASVKGTAFGLDTAATVAATAVAAGIKPGQDLTKYLKLTADAATIAGTSMGEMGQIMNQAQTGGKVYTDTLNQLAGRGLPIFTWLAKEYGVSGAALSDMVKKGQVDAPTLRKVLEENIGGAALTSGNTARGAWKNVGAAFSRLGAQMLTGPVAQTPALFQAIAGGTDRFAGAIKPLSNVINALATDAFGNLTKYINGINFDKIAPKIAVAAGAIARFVAAFRMDPDVAANFARPLDAASSAGTRVRTALNGVVGVIRNIASAIQTGDFSTFAKMFTDVRTIAQPLFPLLVAVGQAVGQVAGSFGKVIAAGAPILPPLLNLLAGVLGFVADNMGKIVPFLPVIALGFIAWRVATTSVLAANRLLTAAELAALPIRLANNAARVVAARAELQVAAANGASTGSILGSIGAWVARTAATVASAVATTAMSVATKVAAAGQWLLNAAMTANPIGIVIALIVALVAGLVWFFTQTELGRTIWANFTRFLGEAWNNVVAVVRTVWNAIVAAFNAGVAFVSGLIATVVSFIQSHWQLLLGIFLGPLGIIIGLVISNFGTIRTVVTTVISAVVSFIATNIRNIQNTWTTVWNAIVAIFRVVWNAMVAFYAPIINAIRATIQTVVTGIQNTWNTVWNAVRTAFQTVWNAMVAVYGPIIRTMASVISSTVNGIRSAWDSTWSGIVSFLRTAWNNIVNAVRTAIGNVVNAVETIRGKVMGALSGAVSWLLSAGRDIISGLVNGIKGAAGNVVSAITGVAQGAISAAKNLLGIRSPSTVFKSIGNFLGKGLQIGVDDSAKDVHESVGKLIDKVKDYFSKSDALTAGQESAIVKHLNKENAALTKMATTREGIATQLKQAQDDLESSIKAKSEFGSSVASSIVGLADVGGVKGLTDADGKTAVVTASDIISKLATTRDAAKTFGSELATLRKLGINDTTYQQLVEAFKSSGDTSYAQALLNGGKAAISTVNNLQGDLSKQAAKLGKTTSANLFDAGIAASRGLVRGLKDRQRDLTDAMEDLAGDLVNALKRKLKIKSPSRVMHEMGGYTAEGLALGITDSSDLVQSSVDSMFRIPSAAVDGMRGIAGGGVTVTNEFNGPMGYTEDQVADHINTRQRRSLQRVGLTRVAT